MILVLTVADDLHADVVISKLEEIEESWIRFNTEGFPQSDRLEARMEGTEYQARLIFPNNKVDLSRIKAVWYRRPHEPNVSASIRDEKVRRVARDESKEALHGLWYTLQHCYWMSWPPNLRVASNKLYQMTVASRLGFEIPQMLITQDPKRAQEFFKLHDGNVIVKPLSGASFTMEGKYLMTYTNRVGFQDLEEIDCVRLAPTLLQEYVPKEIELRITIVEDQVFAAAMYTQMLERTRDDWRRGPPSLVKHEPYQLTNDIRDKCVLLLKHLGLTFGAVDMIKTLDGRYIFIEINPNGQWLWTEELAGLPISEAIALKLARGAARRGRTTCTII